MEGGFAARLRTAPADRYFTALVDLRAQVDLAELGRRLRDSGLGKAARRDAVIRALETVADRRQKALEPLISRLRSEGSIDYVRRVAIVNRLIVEGTAAGIFALAEDPDVWRVLPDWTSAPRKRAAGRTPDSTVRGPGGRFVSWALEAMGVPHLHSAGLDGSGITVAAIDSGVFAGHEQFAGRRLPDPRGWHDPVEGRALPYDTHGHGTMVLSQAVGGNPDGRVLGVAPGASWAMVLGNRENHYSRVHMTLAADRILRVVRPDVLVNAWSHDEEPCTDFDLAFVNAWKAAQIFVVFPAGNSGPLEGTGESPAHLAGAYPDGRPVLSVAGLTPDLVAHVESSRGPSRCGSPAFPSLAVPGSDLPFAFPGAPDVYGTGNGTSLSAGLLGGAAALLLQADPELSPWELEDILLSTARDLPPEGHDIATGAGLVDLPAALRTIRARRSEHDSR